jgi:capsular exopolysaccharide synthesis family protein
MSLLLSSVFGIFLCFLLDYLDDKVKTAKDINEKVRQPVLGIIPRVKSELLDNNSGIKEAGFSSNFWDLRSNIKIATLDKKFKILSITSVLKGEGKSTICKYLAHTLVESGQKVLLVDLNLRRPCLHKIFGVSNSTGLSSFFHGEKEIKDVILPTPVEGLYVIPSGPGVTNALKVIDSPNLLRLIELVKEDYDLVVLDTTAIEDGSDVTVVSSYSDNVILVVASGYVSEDNLKRAIGIIQKAKTNVLGVVLNRSIP